MGADNRLKTIICALALVGLVAGAPRPVHAEKRSPLTVESLYKMSRLSQLVVSPDSPHAAFVVKRFDLEKNKSRSNIWLLSLKTGKVRQLTRAGSDRAPRWLPGGQVAFLSRRSDTTQIWCIDIKGGEASRLTDLPVSIDNFVVAADGRHAAVQARVYPECNTMACQKARADQEKKDPVKARLYDKLLYRIWDEWRDQRLGHVLWVPLDNKGSVRDLTPGSWQTPPLDLNGGRDLSISPDGKQVAFAANTTAQPAWNTNNDVFVVDVKGGRPKNITSKNKAVDAGPVYSPDGKYIAYVAMKRPGFEADRRVLTLYDRKTKKSFPLTEKLDRSVGQFIWSPDSAELLFVVAEQGHRAVYRVAVPSGKLTRTMAKGTNTNVGYVSGENKILFLQQSIMAPPEVFSASTDGSQLTQLTRFNAPVLNTLKPVAVEEIRYAGAAGDPVHGFLIKPPGFSPKKKYPLLIIIHGGPQGMSGNAFHPRWNLQMFTTPGFVVAAFNFHGSTGYGTKFRDAVSKDWGGKPFEDIMKGVDYVAKTFPFVNGHNVSAAGASYGGFMINWILGHTDRFRSLISHAGVYDLTSMYGATEELWFPEWEFGGTPWTSPAQYEKFSPSSYVEKFKTPTLVIHGEHDYRVPYTQGLQLFTALQRQGVESKLLLYPDETHFVQKPQNARLWWHTMLGWLADHAKIRWQAKGRKPGKARKKVKRIAR